MLILKTRWLKAALTHAAQRSIRYCLNGVLIERDEAGDVHIIATDGQRMFIGLATETWCGQVGPWTIIVPTDAVKRAIAGKMPAMQLVAQPDGYYAIGGVIFSPIIGKFPDWRRASFAGDEPRAAQPHQFNWSYVEAASNALKTWYGSSRRSYALHHMEGGRGWMEGSDKTASVIVMSCYE